VNHSVITDHFQRDDRDSETSDGLRLLPLLAPQGKYTDKLDVSTCADSLGHDHIGPLRVSHSQCPLTSWL
ncbi:unnamed protein product, partial [Mycena citricolor]